MNNEDQFNNYWHNDIGMCGCISDEMKVLFYDLLKLHADHLGQPYSQEEFAEWEAKRSAIIRDADPDLIWELIMQIMNNSGLMTHGGNIKNSFFNVDDFVPLLKENIESSINQ